MPHYTPFLALLAFIALPAMAGEIAITKQIIDDEKAVIATVESVQEIQARARIAGTISAVFYKEGDKIKAGERIAVIGDPKLAIRGKSLEASVQSADSSYQKAKLDFTRAKELKDSGYGTQAKLDEAQNNLQKAENDLQSAKAGRQEVAQQSFEGNVLAPSTGRILKIPVSLGSVIMQGETVALLSQENYILRLQLPERHARFLKPGDTVRIGGRGLQEKETDEITTGTVRLVYPKIENGRVIADVIAPDFGNYFVGERTRVYVSAGKREGFFVPTPSLYHRAGMVFVKLKGGQEIVVQIGQKNGNQTEILSGLHDGDIVVTP